MAAVGLIRLQGERRVVLASLIGAAAAATVLGSLGVFRHAVVISSFSPTVARVVCALAFTAGLAGASTGLGLGEADGDRYAAAGLPVADRCRVRATTRPR